MDRREDVSFPFPFSPYDVQEDFMKHLYKVLDSEKIGIFESPTGTGKSLSIICGSLKWLKDFKAQKKMELQNLISEKLNGDGDDWFTGFTKKQEQKFKLQDAKEEYAVLLEYEERIKSLKNNDRSKQNSIQKQSKKFKRRKQDDGENVSVSDDELNLEDGEDKTDELEEKKQKNHVLKIFYASRTHSQLSQFVGEIKQSPFKDEITVTTLGSRSSLCINESLTKLKSLSLMNEHCVDLQRKNIKGKKCCPFLKHDMADMQDTILTSVRDIEETVQLGKQLESCPYYATRNSIPDIEIVVLPYNILLHKPTRDTYGIVLQDNIVIIDEAHNLVESINNIYSSEISGTCLEQALIQIESYHKSYCLRFNPKNLLNIKLLLLVLKSFIASLKCEDASVNHKPFSKMMLYNEFINLTNVGHVNFFELEQFCKQSHLGHKLHGFTSAKVAKGITPWDDQNKEKAPKISGTTELLQKIKSSANPKQQIKLVVKDEEKCDLEYKPSAFFTFHEFLKTLTFPSNDGRILFNKQSSMKMSSIKFLHLNPSSHFKDIITEARSVVLAGGTMQPVSEFIDQLFIPAGIIRDNISLFSCGHVIPAENLLALSLASGPCGSTLDFTFNNRKTPQVVKELGSILLNLCTFVPGGIVCFFPSYDYEEFIYNELTNSKVLDSIEKKKKLFREPKQSSDVDKILASYSKCISFAAKDTVSSCTGALLFSIVGGKMSEGINFSDELGRCVVMVGLPYPNKFSVELKEKMAYLNANCPSENGKKAGDIYYNNLCMKAVNQSIGRAIRHKNDYATIVLLDYRYNNVSVKDSLPNWIGRSLTFHEKFGTAFCLLRKFFSSKKQL